MQSPIPSLYIPQYPKILPQELWELLSRGIVIFRPPLGAARLKVPSPEKYTASPFSFAKQRDISPF